MKLYYILSLIPAFLYLLYKSKKAMHMLQQNWYNDNDRYINWIFDNKSKIFLIFDLLFVVFIFLKDNLLIISFILFYIVAFFIHRNKVKNEQSKKPLVITARIKRLYTTLIIVYLLLIYVTTIMWFNPLNMSFYYFYVSLIIYINYLFVYLCNVINKPIELLVKNHYLRMAKSKLASMTNLKRVAITGSFGKTSTKHILNEILNVKYNSFATAKSYNTMNGLMISINNMLDKFNDIFIAEMGAFTNGEIKRKTAFIKPQYGIITVIGEAHLESFGTLENTTRAKFELVDGLPDDGVAILNMDDKYQVSYDRKSKCRVIWVSTKNRDADVYADNVKLSSSGMKFDVSFKGMKKPVSFETKLLGFKNIYNIIESLALANELGLTPEQMQIGVKRLKAIEHRLELKKYGNIDIIDDAYNSNPSGAKMALEVLSMMDGKKIVVTPGMIELGDKQYEENKKLGLEIADVCDEVILIGEEQTKPIMDGLKEKKYDEKHIHVLKDVKLAFPLMKKLSSDKTYVLLENDLPDMFNE